MALAARISDRVVRRFRTDTPVERKSLLLAVPQQARFAVGASSNDNLFQMQHIESHLDSLSAAGGNYVRNTMSDRDPGDQRAFMRLPDGRYDLDRWNPVYWQKFEHLLKSAEKRGIIVQIEVWDRFDHSQRFWTGDPYNPRNNINYTAQQSGLAEKYPSHPGQNRQPFFFSVPGLDGNETLLKYQQAFVRKLLSIALKYPNVLYCIDNETSGREEWSAYWAAFIREAAGKRTVCITEMWDDWNVRSGMHRRTLDHPERYDFVDISQNAHAKGDANWENALYVRNFLRPTPRPINSVKIYGSDARTHDTNAAHAVATFCRNLLAGMASSRFHRPPAGLGLCTLSLQCIRTVRKIEGIVPFWRLVPGEQPAPGVYPAEAPDGTAVLFFTQGDSVRFVPRNGVRHYEARWYETQTGRMTSGEAKADGNSIRLSPPYARACFAVLIPVSGTD